LTLRRSIISETTYNGIYEKDLSDEEMAGVYENRNVIGLLINQYVFIKNKDGKVVDKKRWDGEKFLSLKYSNYPGQRLGGKLVKPINDEQQALFDLLANDNVTIKQITGVAGSGKNYCAMAFALSRIYKNNSQSKYRKIVLVRNNIEVKDSRSLGALPSGINEKLLPYAMPAADILGSQLALNRMITDEKIELLHLGFARGRNFDNSIVIADECENLTGAHVALLVSRIGKHSIILFLGDQRQVDKVVFEKNSGLNRLSNKLSGNPLYGCVHLKVVERSATAQLAELLQDE